MLRGRNNSEWFEERFTHEWEIVRICARLLKEGKARIIVKTMPSGKKSRYTRIIGR